MVEPSSTTISLSNPSPTNFLYYKRKEKKAKKNSHVITLEGYYFTVIFLQEKNGSSF
jgi:hypothetical protein